MASRSLGTLTLDLVAKIGGFERGLDKAARTTDKRMREIEKRAKVAGKVIGLALVAAGTAVAVALKGSIDAMDDMSKAAQRANLPTEEFSRLAYAGSLADVSMQDLEKSFGKLAKAQGDAARGLSTQVKAFKDLGIEAIDPLTGKLRSTTEVFLEFADVFQKNKGSPEVMALGMEVFGRSFQKLIPLLKDGSQGLREVFDESDRLGKTLDGATGRAAEQFNDNIRKLKARFDALLMDALIPLLPVLVKLQEEFLNSATEGDGLASSAERIGKQMADAAIFVANIYDRLVILRGEMVRLQAVGQGFNPFSRMRAFFDGGDFLREQAKAAEDAAKTVEAARARIANRNSPFFGVTGKATGSWERGAEGGGLTVSAPTPKAGKSGKSDAEKEAERLLQAYERLEASLKQQAALIGETSEVEKLRYELANGELAKLNQAQKDNLLGLAKALDVERERHRLQEEGKRLIQSLLTPVERINEERERAVELLEAGAIAQADYNRAIEALRTPAEQMLEDMQFEIFLLGKTREQQELLTAARYLGAEAATEQGRAALAAMEEWQRGREALSDHIELMDGLRDSAKGFLDDLREGVSVWDSLKNAADRFADVLWEMAANKLIEQLFGKQGEAGGGSAGNWFGQLLGAFFGGGRASGGTVMPGKLYEVGEHDRPEMLMAGGRQYLIPGNAGNVVPMRGGGGFTQVINNNYSAPTDPRTQTQMAAKAGFEAQRALARNTG